MNIINKNSRLVIKIGTSTLTHATGALNLRRIETLVRTLSDIKNAGIEVVLVTSGAVSAGIARLSLDHRPRTVEEKQALAAVGQSELMRIYETFFSNYGHAVGQILMTKDVIEDVERFEQAKSTFATLLRMGCVPIVNENDSVSAKEIRFGGNDPLSTYVAIVCNADLIINMSDIDGLFDKDPRKFADAKKVDRVEAITEEILAYAGGSGTDRGTGGMRTKLEAAAIAADRGIPTLIVNGSDPRCLYDILDGKHIGTYFAADKSKKIPH